MINKLYLYSSKTKQQIEFIPLNASNITMYVCGPTLYDEIHIGNARPLVVFDCLYKLLRILYPSVTYVRNITDVDDKIINKANAEGVSSEQIVAKNLLIYKQNLAALNISKPTHEPLATNYIVEMQEMITHLLNNNFAYINEGNVFFNTANFKQYGELSGKQQDQLIATSDSITENLKQNSADFVLWKPAKKGEPFWESPWGNGRPGWHIECSAMAKKYLGEVFDIHGGGSDLMFPHHENECAQSMAANNRTFLANYWIHNAFINMNSEKMSKSLGNVITINSILSSYNGEVLRLAILMSHYRHPLNFKEDLLIQAKHILDKMYLALNTANAGNSQADHIKPLTQQSITEVDQEFLAALQDDLNTPAAIAVLQSMVTELNKLISANNTAEITKLTTKLIKSANLLGILYCKPNVWLQGEIEEEVVNSSLLTKVDIEQLIAERNSAKLQKNYQVADEIRQKLTAAGIILEDTKAGTTWRKL